MILLDKQQTPPLPEIFARWFAGRGWMPRAHQLELLARAQAGRSVLLIAPTGGGKTLAGFLPSLVELSVPKPTTSRAAGENKRKETVVFDESELPANRPVSPENSAAPEPSYDEQVSDRPD